MSWVSLYRVPGVRGPETSCVCRELHMVQTHKSKDRYTANEVTQVFICNSTLMIREAIIYSGMNKFCFVAGCSRQVALGQCTEYARGVSTKSKCVLSLTGDDHIHCYNDLALEHHCISYQQS